MRTKTRDCTVASWGEIDVISESSNIFFVTVYGKADHGIGGVLPVSNYGLS